MSTGMRVAAAVALVGAFACCVAFPRRSAETSQPHVEQADEELPILEPVYARGVVA